LTPVRLAAATAITLLIAADGFAAPQRTTPQVRPKPDTTNARAPARSWTEQRITLPIVGSGMAYVPKTATSHVVLFISGDGGWNAGVVDMARRIAAQDAIVVGLSFPAWKRAASRDTSWCWYVASDLELISHAAQKALKLPQYHPPVLVGYSSGASVVYAALANTPAVTFAGGLSLGFCPDVEIRREICSSEAWSPDYDEKKGVNTLPPTKSLPKDWFVLQGVQDQVCSVDEVRRFIAGTPGHLSEIDGTGHGFSKPQHWGAPFDAALHELWTEKVAKPAAAQPRSATTRELEDELTKLQLPLELRWPVQLSSLLVFFSGDGGWASLDEDASEQLVTHGVGIVGVSSLRYFWQSKTPAQVAADIKRLVAVLARAGRPIFVGGFSFGADIVPVTLEELTPADRRQVTGLVLIAPSKSASFEIDPLDWVRTPADNPATHTVPAIRQLGLPVLCLSGADETDSPCPALAGAPGVRVSRLPGSHHFKGDYAAVADTVHEFIRSASADRRP